MNRTLILLSLFAAVSLWAFPLADDAFFSLKQIPAELHSTLQPGQDVEFELEENATTGYVWSAVYDARLCRVNLEHKPPRRKLLGAPGKVEVEVESLTETPFTVTLRYARSWEHDKEPLHTIVCTFNGQTTAPAGNNAQPAVRLRERLYRLNDMAPAYQIDLRRGRDVDFDLEEQPAAGKTWKVTSYDRSKVRLEIEHDRADDPDEVDEAEIEIKAIARGESTVVLTYGSNEKSITIKVNAK